MGDAYDWEVDGTLTVTDTISVNNRVSNVWNHVVRLDGPKPGAITIGCSMVDDPTWDGIDGNIPGIPRWDASGCLSEDSMGRGAACDALDIGLLTCP